MFTNDFFPTPIEVINTMCSGLDLIGKTVLEPSAGSGNIIDYLRGEGAKVIACEKHPDLALIAQKKADRFLKHDFLQVTGEEVSHIDFIIMNPPFFYGDKHIRHAWDIAPGGCEIIALCNSNTLDNRYSYERTNLFSLIEKNGNSVRLGNVFSQSERETDVSISMIHLFKPRTGDNEFDGYFDLEDDPEKEGNGIMAYDVLRDCVNRYVGAVKMFDEVVGASQRMNVLIKPINESGNITFGVNQRRDGRDYTVTRDEFKNELQKSAWKAVFAEMNMSKYITKSVMENINKFVEQQVKVPFTLKNIYKMGQMIVGTHAGRMDKVLVDAFDKICSFSHENSEAGTGWKTNSSYKVNQKFILPNIMTTGYSGQMSVNHYGYDRQGDMDDIVKALCHMTGKDYDEMETLNEKVKVRTLPSLNEFISFTFLRDAKGNRVTDTNGYSDKYRYLEFGKWYQWNEFFEIRGYKKGTLHVKFSSESVWMEFNRKVAKIKGWALPRKTDTKTKGTERTSKQGLEIY